MSRRASRTSLALAVAAAIISLSFLGWAAVWRAQDASRIDGLALSTHRSLCSFKEDLARRADDTETYVLELQHGQRRAIPGITIADLRRSLAGQRATIASLSELKCR